MFAIKRIVWLSLLGVGAGLLFASGFGLASPGKGQPVIFSTTTVTNPRVALIIDDVGLDRHLLQDFLKIPAPLTMAIIPCTPYTRECAEAVKAAGFHVNLHLPIDPFRGAKPPGTGFIIKGWLEGDITRQFEGDLADVPEATGVNNHMGSTSPEDEYLTAVVISLVKKHRLFYVDSVTGTGSVAGKYARMYQVPFARRDLFIDHYHSVESKVEALRELLKLALKNGQAIGIGHVRPGTAQAIGLMIPEFEKAGVKLVPVSELVKVEPL